MIYISAKIGSESVFLGTPLNEAGAQLKAAPKSCSKKTASTFMPTVRKIR
jgi:hypothetical protein